MSEKLIEKTFRYENTPPQTNQVLLCGSFTDNWQSRLEMKPLSSTGNTTWTLTKKLPPGKHQFKFIVDGEWMVNEDYEKGTDDMGMVNNVIEVVKEEEQEEKDRPTEDDRNQNGTKIDYKERDVREESMEEDEPKKKGGGGVCVVM